jgi:hypothetical protein
MEVSSSHHNRITVRLWYIVECILMCTFYFGPHLVWKKNKWFYVDMAGAYIFIEFRVDDVLNIVA